MNSIDKPSHFSRRSLLKGAGALVVSIGAPVGAEALFALNSAFAAATPRKPPLVPDQLSSYIAVGADGTVSAFFGKMDMGQGLYVSIGQIVAEELDVRFEAVKVFMADTRTSVNQGGASGSTGIQRGGVQMRAAAAEARRVLVEMAAEKLDTPADQLIVVDGVVSAAFNRDKKTSYAELIGGRHFNVQLAWNKQMGNALYAPGKAKPKDHKQHKIVGKPIKRADIAPKVFCQEPFVTDIKVPNMLHARMLRPPVAGASVVSIDEGSIRDVPGARVVREGNFLAVVADKEWDAVKAHGKLKVQWSDAKPPFPSQDALYDHIRKAPVRRREDVRPNGNVDEAFKNAARVIEAEYEWPFQSHACMGPACAVVEIKDGRVVCYTGSQKPHFVRDGLARTLDVKPETVDGIWVVGPGSYGRNDADDCAMDTAVLAKLAGRPVRLQYTRDQGTGWDPKGPASIHKARAAVDASGKVVAYEFLSKGFSRIDVGTNGSRPEDTLAGHFRGVPLRVADNFGVPAESYGFDHKRTAWETIAPFLDRSSPLRGAHLRDPVGPQIHFASESFMDEVAHAIGVDPIELRLRHVRDPRDAAVLRAAAEKSGWKPRTGPQRQSGNTVNGRGVAYSQRNGTTCAIVAEVEIDCTSGKIWARKFTVAHDCGQIVNPDGHQPHAVGRGEVRFKERHQRRLADLSDPGDRRRAGGHRLRADQPARARADRRGRAVDPAGRRSHRQRHLRRHRRAAAPRAVLAGQGEKRAVVSYKRIPIPQ